MKLMNKRSIKSVMNLTMLAVAVALILVAGSGLAGMKVLKLTTYELAEVNHLLAALGQMSAKHDAIRGDAGMALSHSLLNNADRVQQDAASFERHLDGLKAAYDDFIGHELETQQGMDMDMFKSTFESYLNNARILIEQAHNGYIQDTDFGNFKRDYKDLEIHYADITAELQSKLSNARTDAERTFTLSLVAILISCGLATFLILAVRQGITQSVQAPLETLKRHVATLVSTNDLTARIKPQGVQEIHTLGATFNQLTTSLQNIVRDLATASVNLRDCSGELRSSADESMNAFEHTTDSIAQISTSVEELSSSIATVTFQADEANNLSVASMLLSQQSFRSMQTANQQMVEIAKVVRESAKEMAVMESNAAAIADISSVIGTIADQTDLLALNAGIEAALAGDQGRGFAVVATEVRRLAERTADSTRRIRDIVGSIQNATAESSRKMRDGLDKVNSGEEISKQVHEVIVQVEQNSKYACDSVGLIAENLREQKLSGSAISKAAEEVGLQAEHGLSLARHAVQQSERLDELSDNLAEKVQQFKI